MTTITNKGKYHTSNTLSRKDSRELTSNIKISEQKERLLADLRDLSERYSELISRTSYAVLSKSDLEEKNKKLIESGQLIIDFYKKKFLPQYSRYSGSEKFFRDVGGLLEGAVIIASESIKGKNYFGLQVLLIERGSVKGDPNDLEALIQRLSKRV